MANFRKIKKFSDGSLYQENNNYFFEDVDGRSELFNSKQDAEDSYFIKQAYSYLGSAIRDNTREEKISIGKDVDKGLID